MAQSKYIKQNGETVYPITLAENVFFEGGGENVKDAFNGLFAVKTVSTTTGGTNGPWSANIYLEGYRPVMWELRYNNSGTTDVAAEAWSNRGTTSELISGYCSRSNHTINVIVLYIKEEFVNFLN